MSNNIDAIANSSCRLSMDKSPRGIRRASLSAAVSSSLYRSGITGVSISFTGRPSSSSRYKTVSHHSPRSPRTMTCRVRMNEWYCTPEKSYSAVLPESKHTQTVSLAFSRTGLPGKGPVLESVSVTGCIVRSPRIT